MHQDTGQIKAVSELSREERASGKWRIVTPRVMRREKSKALDKYKKADLKRTYGVSGKRATKMLKRMRRTGSLTG